MPTLTLFFLAQAESSGTTDFLQQISGLLLFTCAVGAIWIFLMAVVFQRANERRRRKALGLAPLPAIHISAYQWLSRTFGSPQPRPAAPPPFEAPDLDALTADLPQPDLAAIVGHVEPPARAPEPDPDPALEPDPEAEPEQEPEIEPDPGGWRDEAPEADDRYPAAEPPREAQVPLPPDQPPADSVELLRVWRDVADGGLILEIAGQRFRTLDELRSAEFERRFVSVLRELNDLPSSRSLRAAAGGGEESKARQKDKEKDKGGPDTLPSMSPGAMLRQMRRVAMGQVPDPVEQPPDLSIADQIEVLLQARLADHAEFAGRSIHVKPSFQGGVRIEVDGHYYDGVGEIDDEAVRSLLADVVRQWEQGG